MKCKITVTGSDAQRFKNLSDKFGGRAALETLLENDGTNTIDGFISDVEEGNRINALSYFTLNNLIASEGLSSLDLRSKFIESDKFNNAMRAARENLVAIMENNLSEEEVSEDNRRIASRAFVAYINFGKLMPKIQARFEAFGLTVNELNQNFEEIIRNEGEISNNKQHIYSQSFMERSPLDSTPPSVKLFLATRAKQQLNADGTPIPILDDIGMQVPVDFDALYSRISKGLTDLHSYEEMITKLKEMSKNDAEIRSVLDTMIDGDLDKHGIEFKGVKTKPFQNAFFSSMANTHYDFMTLAIDKDYGSEIEGSKKVSMLRTNKRSLDRALRNEWAANSMKVSKLPLATRQGLWDTHVHKVFDSSQSATTPAEKRKMKSDFSLKLDNVNAKSVLVDVSNMLALLGINVSPQAVDILRTTLNNKKPGEFKAFVQSRLYNLGKAYYNENRNIFEDESGTITILATAQASLSSELGVQAFMNGENNIIYPINRPTFAKEWFNNMKNKTDVLTRLSLDPFYSGFKIVQDFNQAEHGMEMISFDTITDNSSGVATSYSSLDPVSSMASRFNFFLNYDAKGRVGAHTNKFGWFLVPTPADRSGTQVLKMKLIGDGSLINKYSVFSEAAGYKDWAVNSAKAEFERIKLVFQEYNSTENKKELVKNYHYTEEEGVEGTKLGNGGYFQNFTELNKFLVVKDGILQNINFESPVILQALEQSLNDQIAADIRHLGEIGFLNTVEGQAVVKEQSLTGNNNNSDISITTPEQSKITSIKSTEHANNLLSNGGVVTENNLYKFLINSYVANQELSALFHGDLANFTAKETTIADYKGDPTTVQLASYNNANKRSGLAYTPGKKGRVGLGGMNATFSVAFVADVRSVLGGDIYNDVLNSLSEDHRYGRKQAEKYGKTNSTDGQGLASLYRYADILNGQGLLTPSMLETLIELEKQPENINWSKVTEKLVAVKGFYHAVEFDPHFGRVMTKNLKYSLLPVFPAMMKGNTALQDLYNKMIDSKTDELVFESGIKMGAYNLNQVSDPTFSIVALNNENYRIPQEVPYKDKVEENYGSQIRKLIEGNLVDDADYNGRSGESLRSIYNQAQSLKIENSFKDMLRTLATDGKIDIEKVAKRILRDLAKNQYKSDSEFINKALEIITTETGAKDTRIPMSFPAIKYKAESAMNTMVKKAVHRLSLPGFVGVVYSSYGMDEKQIGFDKSLKFVRKGPDGRTLPAQVKMSPQYFLGILRNKIKDITGEIAAINNDVSVRKMQTEIASIRSVIQEMERGEFDIKRLPAKLRQAVIYRIPTQGKNSMLPVEIVAFTPEAFSTSITLPSAIVTQSGMDFDIDKVYVESRHFTYSNGEFSVAQSNLSTAEGIDNTIIDAHYDVLTSPQHFSELVTPNNSDTLEDLSKEISGIYDVNTEGRKWSSVSTQDSFRDRSQSAEVTLGVSSNANTAHAIYQSLGVTVKNRLETSNDVDLRRSTEQNEAKSRESSYGPKIDYGRSWSELRSKKVYTTAKDGTLLVNTMRTSNREGGAHAHFGNPFTENILAASRNSSLIKSDSVSEAIDRYEKWIKGEPITGLTTEQEATLQGHENQKKWIVKEISNKKMTAAVLMYDSSLAGRGLGTHADVLQKVIAENSGINNMTNSSGAEATNVVNVYSSDSEASSLSNFAPRPFMLGDFVTYPTVEHAFQMQKIEDSRGVYSEDQKYILRERMLKMTAAEAKVAGAKVKGLDLNYWDKNSSELLKIIMRASFDANPSAVTRLLETGDAAISHKDSSGKEQDKGQFSRLLMELREEYGGTGVVQPGITTPTFTQGGATQIKKDTKPVATDKKGVLVNGERVRTLGEIYTNSDKKRKISDDHIETQTAAVDNPTLLGSLNINPATGAAYFFMIESGAGLNYAVKLINTPIIRELIRRTRINETSMGKEGAFSNAMSDLAKERGFDIEKEFNTDSDVKENVLDRVLGHAREGKMQTMHDLNILKAYMTFRHYGNELNTFQKALRADVIGTRQTQAANIIATQDIAKVKGTYSSENIPESEIGFQVQAFTFNKSKYDSHSLKTFEEYGLHKAIDIVGTYVADSSKTFRDVLSQLRKDFGGQMTDRDARIIVNDFYTYIFANKRAHMQKLSVIAKNSPETVVQMMMGDNSVGKQVLEAKLIETQMAREDVSFIPNQLLSYLSVTPDNGRTGYDTVSFNNSISRALSTDQKTMFANEFESLLYYDKSSNTDTNSFFRNLGVQLFALNFFTEGFSRGINSYSEFIPITMYEDFRETGGESLVEYFRDIWPDFKNTANFTTEHFKKMVLANRAHELTSLKDLRKMSKSNITKYLAQNANVNVFLMKLGDTEVIGKRLDEEGNYTGIIKLLGTKGWRVDYQADGAVSQVLSANKVLIQEKARKNVQESRNSKC